MIAPLPIQINKMHLHFLEEEEEKKTIQFWNGKET